MSGKVVSRKNQLRNILFMIALMAVTIAVILKDYTIKELMDAVREIHFVYLLTGILLMLLYAGCQAVNFSMIMGSLGQSSSIKNCMEYTCIGIYFNAITPGAVGGQPAQIYYMNKDKIHVDISSITIFLVTFAGQIVIILMGGVFSLLRYPLLAGSEPWFSYLLLGGTAVTLCLILILFALMFSSKTVPFLLNLVFKVGVKTHVIKKPNEIQDKLHLLMLSYREKAKLIQKHPKLILKVFVVTVLQWILFCMVSYLIYLSFGLRSSDALDLMAGQAFINIAVAAVPLPGSVGVAEKAYLILYGQFYLLNQLTSAMIISRLISFYLPLVISFFVYLFAHHRMMKAKHHKT